jgi:hypothetical protein
MDGCFAVYLLATGFVVRAGICAPGLENEQVADPETEGVVYHDMGVINPDQWRVEDGQLVQISVD